MTVPPDKKSLRPVDCIVMVKDDLVFMFIGAAKKTGDISAVLDAWVAGWKWKKI